MNGTSLYSLDSHPVTHPTVSEHWRKQAWLTQCCITISGQQFYYNHFTAPGLCPDYLGKPVPER